MATWTVIYERGPTSWGAYVPRSARSRGRGRDRAEVEQLIREAIPFHLEGLAEDGLPVPDPASVEADAVAV
jgi:predicted RNase H-like HicB family nuclease